MDLSKPEYRVRLFLSVDLTGSTDFKARIGHTSLVWLKAFQKFYGEFPSMFARNYAEACGVIPDIGPAEAECLPKVWKTIGDEILFVNRVDSITHLGAYVSSFAETLKDFGGDIYDIHQLNTKGNGWIAAFPSPNCSISLSKGADDPLSGSNEILTEDFERQVDEAPHKFDFLGKGIDGGFRISRNSTIDTFTISPALAYLLCRAKRNNETTKFDCDFQFHEPQQLKGVVGGKHYPIVSIDTNRDQQQKQIKDLQAELLQQPASADFAKLAEYLEKYIDYHGIEKPALKLAHGSAPVSEPQHYQSYIADWESEADKIVSAMKLEQEASEADGKGAAVDVPTASLADALSAVHKFLDVYSKATTPKQKPFEPED